MIKGGGPDMYGVMWSFFLAEGVNWANVLKCDFFDANHVWMIKLDGSWSLGPEGPPQWSGQKYSKIWQTFHITGHHAPTRVSFHPKTRQEDFLYDTKSS
jgi:hypothetical protein